MSTPARKRPRGRPRKPLPGGHRTRRPGPTEDAKLRQAVRELNAPVKRTGTKRTVPPDDPGWEVDSKGRRVFRLRKGSAAVGRPKGKKDRVPKSVRASVAAILTRVVKEKHKTVESAIVDGISSGPRHADRYLRLAAEYVDGKPVDTVHLNASFNQTELKTAREQLGAKLSTMLATLLVRSESEE